MPDNAGRWTSPVSGPACRVGARSLAVDVNRPVPLLESSFASYLSRSSRSSTRVPESSKARGGRAQKTPRRTEGHWGGQSQISFESRPKLCEMYTQAMSPRLLRAISLVKRPKKKKSPGRARLTLPKSFVSAQRRMGRLRQPHKRRMIWQFAEMCAEGFTPGVPTTGPQREWRAPSVQAP